MYLSDILTVPSISDQERAFWTSASAMGVPVRRIGSRSVMYLLMTAMIRKGSNILWQTIAQMGDGLTNLLNSSGGYLDILANFYQVKRYSLSATQGYLYVNINATGISIVTLTGQDGVTYTAKTFDSLVHNNGTTGPAYLLFTAQQLGSVGNQIPVYFTSATNNCSLSSNVSDLTWITKQGTDDETDQQLIQRCLDQIALLALGSTPQSLSAWLRKKTYNAAARTAFQYNALASPPYVTVYVAGQNAAIPLYLSGSTPNPLWTQVQSLVQYYTGAEQAAVAAQPTVLRLALCGNVYYKSSATLAQATAVMQKLCQWFDKLPINDGTPASTVYVANIYEALRALDTQGIIVAYQCRVSVNGGATVDFQLSKDSEPFFTLGLWTIYQTTLAPTHNTVIAVLNSNLNFVAVSPGSV